MNARHSSSILSGAAARQALLASLSTSARAIGASLGPNGRGTAYEIGTASVGLVHGGASIARYVSGESGSQSVASRILTEALDHAQRDLGDGTARLACIANALYRSAVKRVAAGVDPGLLSRALRDIGGTAAVQLQSMQCPAPTPEEIAFAACRDAEVSKALAGIVEHLSIPGAVDVREGWRAGVELIENHGFCFDVSDEVVGLSPDERGARIELEKAHVLVVNETLADFGSLAGVLDAFRAHDKSLLVVARGIVGAAAATLTANRAALQLHLVGLVPEAAGPRAVHVLEDLSLATGATLVSQETGLSLASLTPAMLGRAEHAVIERGRCLLSGPNGDRTAVRSKQKALELEAEAQKNLSLDREWALTRSARLGGYWAELRVAGSTTASTAERIDRARSAVSALRAATEQGVVPGAGFALADLAKAIATSPRTMRWPEDVEGAARNAICDACHSIRLQLATNAGVEPSALNVDDSVVDPLSTTVAILNRAVSVAATMLTIEVLLC